MFVGWYRYRYNTNAQCTTQRTYWTRPRFQGRGIKRVFCLIFRNDAVEPINKLLATGCYLIYLTVVGDLGGFSETAARGFIKETTRAIARFPDVIGAIDCTHVRLLSPGGDFAEEFRNRKGYFSINVQTIFDANLRVLDCVARWPGMGHKIYLKSHISATRIKLWTSVGT